LADVALTIKEEVRGRKPDQEFCIQTLLEWIRTDRKHPALKKLQGYIWEEGYQIGSYQGHIYPDAYENIRNWLQQGLQLGIYSSGSVKAQQLLFGYSSYGNLNNLFAFNFDTSVGSKKEAMSYQRICHEVALPPEEIVFLSDSVEELIAAREANYNIIQIQRDASKNVPNAEKSSRWPVVKDFFEADRIIRSQ
jgi:enolase-phosphatase E1